MPAGKNYIKPQAPAKTPISMTYFTLITIRLYLTFIVVFLRNIPYDNPSAEAIFVSSLRSSFYEKPFITVPDGRPQRNNDSSSQRTDVNLSSPNILCNNLM